MKTIGIFEAKTKLSEICDEVARTRTRVTITRRGSPLVYIEPIAEQRLTIKERRAAYMSVHRVDETDDVVDFEPAVRSKEISVYRLEE